jgi:hypothetical protein
MRLRKTNFFFGLGLWLLLAVMIGHAQNSSPAPREYQLKAAFLYNFAKFIDWPPEAFAVDNAHFIIGILGDNPFGNDLQQTVKDKNISGREIAVRLFHTVGEVTNCQILFISSSEKKRYSDIIRSLHSAAILTVTENDQSKDSDVMINFVQESGKIRFQIKDSAAKAAQLRISSKLLSLAVPSPR